MIGRVGLSTGVGFPLMVVRSFLLLLSRVTKQSRKGILLYIFLDLLCKPFVSVMSVAAFVNIIDSVFVYSYESTSTM